MHWRDGRLPPKRLKIVCDESSAYLFQPLHQSEAWLHYSDMYWFGLLKADNINISSLSLIHDSKQTFFVDPDVCLVLWWMVLSEMNKPSSGEGDKRGGAYMGCWENQTPDLMHLKENNIPLDQIPSAPLFSVGRTDAYDIKDYKFRP